MEYSFTFRKIGHMAGMSSPLQTDVFLCQSERGVWVWVEWETGGDRERESCNYSAHFRSQRKGIMTIQLRT